jgi:SNF2 family DNA or RNA helicase
MILKTELYDHQKKAVEKLINLKVGALYMEMGTGKTRTAMELIKHRLDCGKINKAIWLCPYSVKNNLKEDLLKHTDNIDFIEIYGIESLSSSLKLNCKLLNIVKDDKVFLIVDESNLVKNHYANRTIAITRLSQYCAYKLILNGTPISKSEKDLYSQWKILDWRILGYQSFWSFAANHLEYDQYKKGRIVRCLNTDYLTKKIAPYSYQIRKSECLDLPYKTYSTRYFDMTEDQMQEYENAKMCFLALVDEFDSAGIYRLFTALQLVVSGNEVFGGYKKPITHKPLFKNIKDNPRIQALTNIIENIDGKIIIWCKFTQEIKDIEKILIEEYGEEQVCTFFGEMNTKKRNLNKEKFKNSARFFIANKTCAGYGLNLQFCSNMIYYSNDFNWATRAQSEDRVHRIGQENNVHIVDLCAYDTIDKRILKSLGNKENLSDSFKSLLDKYKDNKKLSDWIDGKELKDAESI